MSNELFLLLVLSALQVVRVAALQVAISPDNVRKGMEQRPVTFTCTADTALVGCQVMWYDWDLKTEGPLLDLSRGNMSRVNRSLLNDEVRGYRYNGQGLEAGECGVTLLVAGWKLWMVGCRMRAESGAWQYAWASLFASGRASIPHTNLTSPREVVVLPGGEARFSVKTQERLSYCSIRMPGLSFILEYSRGGASPNSTGRHRQLGSGTQNGECGTALSDITEEDNGYVVVYLFDASGDKEESRFMQLIVANPPPVPRMRIAYTGTNLTATCRVRNSRPVANITWFLGDKVIRQDEINDIHSSPNDTWRWPWMEGSIMQTLTLQLKPEDQGQVLKCVVSHVALDQPLEASRVISILGSTSG